MVLRVLTAPPTPRHIGRHTYTCGCLTCRVAVAARQPAVCRCNQPVVDSTDDHANCIRCGRTIPATLQAAA